MKCRECNITLCANPCFEVDHTKLHFRASTDSKMEKRNPQITVNSTTSINELVFFRSVFLMRYWGMNMVWISQKGFTKEQRLVTEVYMCVVYASLRQY